MAFNDETKRVDLMQLVNTGEIKLPKIQGLPGDSKFREYSASSLESASTATGTQKYSSSLQSTRDPQRHTSNSVSLGTTGELQEGCLSANDLPDFAPLLNNETCL